MVWAVRTLAHQSLRATRGRTQSPSAGRKPEARAPAALSAVASSRQLGAGEARRRGPKRRAGSVEQDARQGLVPTTLSERGLVGLCPRSGPHH
jgi:hypothetical protein